MTSKNNLSVEPYKGTRDFYPKDQFIQNYIFGIWRKVCESYGYLEYNASILEETELYKSKSGEEIVNEQTYSFIDRGGRNVTIRPEMTPTVARLVAQKRKELTFPLRWFSMPNLFRYERPQRGRLREHWQLNADIFGVESVEADVEALSLAYDMMKEFGAKDEQFELRISNRRLMNFLLSDYLKLDEQQAHKASKLIDKMGKMEKEAFKDALKEAVGEKSETLLASLSKTAIEDLDEKLKDSQGARELLEVFNKLKALGIENLKFDLSIVRGFDYYTGTVFEMYDTNKVNPRALFGGGRYDDLVGIFGVEKISGIGFGWGDVTTRDFLETYDLLPEYRPPVKLYICHLEGYLDEANKLARHLRSQGVSVAVDLTGRKISQQVKTADKEGIPFVTVVGEEEVKNGKYKVKSLREGKEVEAGKDEIFKILN